MSQILTTINKRAVVLNSLTISNSLLYYIKTIFGESENEIISHMYSVGIGIFNDYVEKNKNRKNDRGCGRAVNVCYKDSDISFRLAVYSGSLNSRYANDNPIKVSIHIGHIKADDLVIDGGDIENMLCESALNLTNDQLLVANKPKQKIYRFMKNKKQPMKEELISFLPNELKMKYGNNA